MKRRIVLLLSAALAACAAVWMTLHDKGDGRVPESASTAVVQSVASPWVSDIFCPIESDTFYKYM